MQNGGTMQNAAHHVLRASLVVALLATTTVAAPAQPETGPSCAATIRAVMADITARDLATNGAPPLNAFVTLNPFAVVQAEALDRAAAAGEPKGALFCVPVAVKDNFDT
jgi:Asp-tRNA(Asn)/Glu-tRNA(Gln) amidotransferase A subunit family amidase